MAQKWYKYYKVGGVRFQRVSYKIMDSGCNQKRKIKSTRKVKEDGWSSPLQTKKEIKRGINVSFAHGCRGGP